MSCRYYYFQSGEYHCGKCDKDVNSDWYYKYCRNYDYDDCPVYKGNISEPPGSGDSSGCFITSACVRAKGLCDDCYELQLLREYRDNWLCRTEKGTFEIARYYEIAPKIVKVIDKSPRSKEIYEAIYDEMIKICVEFIEQKKYEKAFEHYRQMTLQLAENFVEGEI